MLGHFKEDYLQILKCARFIYTDYVVSEKVGTPETDLNTQVGWQYFTFR